MEVLARGQDYSLMRNNGEGATANFLALPDNILQIILHNMTYQEEVALRLGKMKAGFLYQNGCLLWLFRFYDNKGRLLLSYDAPYDVRIIPKDMLNIPNIESEFQRLSIMVHAIDENNILRGMRGITMSPKLTRDFLSAVQDQMSINQTNNLTMEAWNNKSVSALISQATMHTMGE